MKIGHWVKKTRDETFVERMPWTHREPLRKHRWIGGCTDTNEFNYLVANPCAAWVCYLKPRPVFDTVRRSPVWGPHSDAER
jgi:hypothetical protein